MPPMVSVCIPTYNRREYLRLTIESVFAQTFTDYEVVILDDGSEDGTAEMVRSLKQPIRYFWQSNRGDAAAKNKLIELACGKYVTLLDSDDLLFADALARLVERLQGNEDAVAYGAYIRINSEGEYIGRDKRKLYSGNILVPLFKTILVHPNGSLFPKKILQRYGGFDERLPVCSDYALFLKMALSVPFLAVPDPTFQRRRHGSNLSLLRYRNAMTELKVLEEFYLSAAKNRIPSKVAKERLAAQAYRSGKLALAEKKLDEAEKMMRRSLQYKPALKPLIQLLRLKVTAGNFQGPDGD